LGVGDTSPHTRAVIVEDVDGSGPLTGVKQIVAGWNHACARVTGGQVRCWGLNGDGQLGDGTPTTRPTPVVVSNPSGSGPLTGVTQLSAGLASTCARLTTGQAVCWGNNSNHQAGDGTNSDRFRPVSVRNSSNSSPLTGIAQVATGNFFSCARLTSGQARCWGVPPGGATELPLAVMNPTGTAPLTGIRAVAAGPNTACYVLESARVRCAGANMKGQLGDRTLTFRSHPVSMVNAEGTTLMSGVVSVAPGQHHTCVRRTGGGVQCVGGNGVGQLGDGSGVDTARPVGVRR
jgi:alpha-tubulin suppressor-like RCC1 family protein